MHLTNDKTLNYSFGCAAGTIQLSIHKWLQKQTQDINNAMTTEQALCNLHHFLCPFKLNKYLRIYKEINEKLHLEAYAKTDISQPYGCY